MEDFADVLGRILRPLFTASFAMPGRIEFAGVFPFAISAIATVKSAQPIHSASRLPTFAIVLYRVTGVVKNQIAFFFLGFLPTIQDFLMSKTITNRALRARPVTVERLDQRQRRRKRVGRQASS
jgi:hypothetical protein